MSDRNHTRIQTPENYKYALDVGTVTDLDQLDGPTQVFVIIYIPFNCMAPESENRTNLRACLHNCWRRKAEHFHSIQTPWRLQRRKVQSS